MKKIHLFVLLSLFSSYKIFAQFNEYHPEYDWYTIKGKNVEVHYHEEAERTARVVAKIADEVWGPITSLYQYEPDKVHYVIKDIDDYSNGATYFFDNKIEIWASALDFDLRGTHNWLRNVITHEFTHMVQIQAAMKISRSIPAIYLQFLNYEDKRRPDILYGFPNFVASYPVATVNMPAWFAEGTAQYQRKELNYENWDSHRDMILRCYALDDKMLTWDEMGVFGKTSLGNESVYNSGFALTRYISGIYGEDKLRLITEKLGKLTNFTVDAAFKDVLGKDGDEIYDEWKDFITKDYNARTSGLRNNLVEGEQIGKEGFGNFYPVFTEDGSKVFYLSNKGMDYLSLTSLYEYNLKSGEEKLISPKVKTTASLIPGTKKIVYSKLDDDNPRWVNIHDLYVYDTETEEETRITFGLRANNSFVSNDGKNIVFVYQKDGTTNIGMVNIDGKNFRRITVFENGEQVFNPRFSPDDSFIVFGFAEGNGQDIYKIDTNGTNLTAVLNEKYEERNPVFGKDGKFYYSSDKTGIFNIYRKDLETGEETQITNVTGGAFMPATDSYGNIAYAGYTSSGYKLCYLKNENLVQVSPEYSYQSGGVIFTDEKAKGDIANFNIDYLKNYNDRETPDYEKKRYSGSFTKIMAVPFIRYDNYSTGNTTLEKFKPGVYLMSSDMLNRMDIFAGGSINSRMERDLFLQFNYRNKLPLIYNLGLKPELSLELYSISRKADADIMFNVDSTSGTAIADYQLKTEVAYNLFEFDIAAKHRLFIENSNIEFRYIYSRYTSTVGSFNYYSFVEEKYLNSPAFNDVYLKGSNFQIKYTFSAEMPYIDSDINPIGMETEITYNYEMNKFNSTQEYEYDESVGYIGKYTDFDFHKLDFLQKNYFSLGKGHTLNATLRAATIFGPTVDDFFDFYLGGLIGMKAYPFYAISGNELGWFNLSYRFPLYRNIDSRLGHIYIDKIFMSVYGDIGNAWNGKMPSLNKFKKGAGAELRIQMNSFYLFPTTLFFNAAYSFDTVEKVVRRETVKYGKEWQFYGGILFDFSL
ncbi:MAG: biopolymer transporter Tol [Ignavibacteria bacterium]|nr:biopolymer transporter Tol [Ignavibacteria bacterium]